MGFHSVTIHESMIRLAERCKTAARHETVSCLREAYQLLYDDRVTGVGAAGRILDTLIEALALNEAAILLIPVGCTDRVDWHRLKGDALTSIVYEVSIERLEDASAIGYCESPYRPLAYCGAAMLAHARILEQESVG